jgi:hypothetical protein
MLLLSGACRGAVMYFERMCICDTETLPAEPCPHFCLRNWSRLFGHLGTSRVLDEPWPPNTDDPVPDDCGGAICITFDGSRPKLLLVESPRDSVVAGLWPVFSHNGFDVSVTPTPDLARAAINCLVGAYPGMLARGAPFLAGDVGVFVRLEGEAGYILKRDYKLGREHGHYVTVLKERGEWTWFSCAVNDTIPAGVYVVNCRLQHDTEKQEVNALMESSSIDDRPCGFVVELEFIDCLSTPLAGLALRQAYMRAYDMPVLAPDKGGHFFVSDLAPGSCGYTAVVPDEAVVTPGGELMMATRRDALLYGQSPFSAIARNAPRWDRGMAQVLGKQWNVLRELWVRHHRIPARLLAHPSVHAIAQGDFYRWAAGEYVIDGKIDDPTYIQWLVQQMQKPDSEIGKFVPPPVLAVLSPSSLDAKFWCGESLLHLHDSCDSRLHRFDDDFMDTVGPVGGEIFSPHWQARYDEAVQHADPALLLKLIEKWGSIPPIKSGDGCGWATISDRLETGDHEEGWPAFDECFEHFVEPRTKVSPPVCTLMTSSHEECWLWSNYTLESLKVRIYRYGAGAT